MTFILILLLGGFFMSMLMNIVMRKIFVANGIFDAIEGRSSHNEKNITRSGGIAIIVSCILIYLIIRYGNTSEIGFTFWFSLVIIALLGVFDDIFTLHYRKKFFVQLLVGIILATGDFRIDHFYGILGINEIPIAVSYMVTIFIYLIIVNAINFIDGIDGLAALTAINFFITIFILSVPNSQSFSYFIVAIIGSIIGFLLFNLRATKKVFLGDTGSLALGTIISYFAFWLLSSKTELYADAFINRAYLVVLMLIFPLTDFLRVIIVRAKNKVSILEPDKNHLHHLLLNKGFTHFTSTFIIFTINIFLVLINAILFDYVGLIGCIVTTIFIMILIFFKIFK